MGKLEDLKSNFDDDIEKMRQLERGYEIVLRDYPEYEIF
jgi:hypothetical protein